MESGAHTETVRVARISLLVTVALVAMKLVGAYLSDSLALYSLASESAIDLFSVLITLVAVQITSRPADDDHLYGHGKFDTLGSLLQNILLLGISVWIFYEALDRLQHQSNHPVTVDAITFSILIVAFTLDFWRSRKLRHVGIEERSQSLQADSLHFLGDSLSIVVVFAGLILTKYFHLAGADSYAAMLVSGVITVLSIKMGKRSLDELTDRFPYQHDYSRIAQLIKQIPGVLGTESLRMRRSGPSLFVESTIGINRVLPFASVEHILNAIKQSVESEFPGAVLNLHPLATKTEYESTFETIKLITSEAGILPHNIELSKDPQGNVTLDLHLEFPSNSSLQKAHDESEEIEKHIRLDLPSISKIIIHLEEERPDYELTTVRDVTVKSAGRVEDIERFVIDSDKAVILIRDVTLFESEPFNDLKLTFTIVLERTLSLSDAHSIVTGLERKIRKKYPELTRIVIHSEPQESEKKPAFED